jgi:hypothetical protein
MSLERTETEMYLTKHVIYFDQYLVIAYFHGSQDTVRGGARRFGQSRTLEQHANNNHLLQCIEMQIRAAMKVGGLLSSEVLTGSCTVPFVEDRQRMI